MSHKTYMIAITIQNTNLHSLELELKTSPLFLAYWNYIPLIYCIKSNFSAQDITITLNQFCPGGGYIIAEVNPININGLLPKQAWDWFYEPIQHKGLLNKLTSLGGTGMKLP